MAKVNVSDSELDLLAIASSIDYRRPKLKKI